MLEMNIRYDTSKVNGILAWEVAERAVEITKEIFGIKVALDFRPFGKTIGMPAILIHTDLLDNGTFREGLVKKVHQAVLNAARPLLPKPLKVEHYVKRHIGVCGRIEGTGYFQE